MIKTLEHWFTMVHAPPEVREVIETMYRVLGYATVRKDDDGNPLVSSMFLMHAKAASVS